MTVDAHTFVNLLCKILNKSSYFTGKEINGLVALAAALIGSRVFSIRSVAKHSGGQFTRNFLSECLKKYAYVQRSVTKVAFGMVHDWPSCREKVFLLLDDTLIKKRGKAIFGSVKWFDHTLGRCVQALCVVNVAVAVRGQVIFILPWVLGASKRPPAEAGTRVKEQDRKTLAGIGLIEELLTFLLDVGVTKKQVVLLADAWFSNKVMITFIKGIKLCYRIDARKNYQVQVPDKEAKKKQQRAKQGRRKRACIKWVPLEEYLGKPESWSVFTDRETGEQVSYHAATVTLKSAGKVRVYAYGRERSTTTKFILTPAQRTRPPTAQTVYQDYRIRWRIEEAHKDLKQHFGLTKSQGRDAWLVHGFIGLVYGVYSLWKGETATDHVLTGDHVCCQEWAEEFHNVQIRDKKACEA